MLSVGNSTGPFVGTILYNLVGYLLMFMIIGGLSFILFWIIKLTMPVEIQEEDKDTTKLAQGQNSDAENSLQEVSC